MNSFHPSQPPQQRPGNTTETSPATEALPTEALSVDSQYLLQGRSTVDIEHAGTRYRLRVTRENKLILTK